MIVERGGCPAVAHQGAAIVAQGEEGKEGLGVPVQLPIPDDRGLGKGGLGALNRIAGKLRKVAEQVWRGDMGPHVPNHAFSKRGRQKFDRHLSIGGAEGSLPQIDRPPAGIAEAKIRGGIKEELGHVVLERQLSLRLVEELTGIFHRDGVIHHLWRNIPHPLQHIHLVQLFVPQHAQVQRVEAGGIGEGGFFPFVEGVPLLVFHHAF